MELSRSTREKGLYMIFIDLEKSYDQLPREICILVRDGHLRVWVESGP